MCLALGADYAISTMLQQQRKVNYQAATNGPNYQTGKSFPGQFPGKFPGKFPSKFPGKWKISREIERPGPDILRIRDGEFSWKFQVK